MTVDASPPPVTRLLARFAVDTLPEQIPLQAQTETRRAFLNWMGCVIGGCHEPPVLTTLATMQALAGPPQATVFGHRLRLDALTAAYINCMSSGVHTYDDTHLKTVAHPTGPIASAMFPLAEREPVSGDRFLSALTIGLEIACRLSNALYVAPARCHIGFSMTGLTCGIGAAAACGRLLGLDPEQMSAALGIAATQAGGFRETHQSEAAYLLCANAARSGLFAALLAKRGLTCSQTALEGSKGFLSVFASPANPAAAVENLGEQYEMLELAYKPYPCGIVVHPIIDVCLDASERLGDKASSLSKIELTVPSIAVKLATQAAPRTPFEAQVSMHHWAAAALLHKAAGLLEAAADCVTDAAVVALRQRVSVRGDADMSDVEARGTFHLEGGETFDIHVPHCRGSIGRPLTDAELEEKFMGQAMMLYSRETAAVIMASCRDVASENDVGRMAQRYFL